MATKDRSVRRQRLRALIFTVGLLLFLGGGLVLVRDHQRTTDSVRPRGGGEDRDRFHKPEAVGPAQGEDLQAYTRAKAALIRSRASSEPTRQSFAVISFDSYRKSKEVTAFLKGRSVQVVGFQIRVPLPGYPPMSVEVRGRPMGQVLRAEAGSGLVRRLSRELSELERIIPTVENEAFKVVYQEAAADKRRALVVLGSDPPAVFAVIVRSTNSSLGRMGGAAGVRLVDVPNNPNSSPGTHDFYGVLPEDEQVAGWGAQGNSR